MAELNENISIAPDGEIVLRVGNFELNFMEDTPEDVASVFYPDGSYDDRFTDAIDIASLREFLELIDERIRNS